MKYIIQLTTSDTDRFFGCKFNGAVNLPVITTSKETAYLFDTVAEAIEGEDKLEDAGFFKKNLTHGIIVYFDTLEPVSSDILRQ